MTDPRSILVVDDEELSRKSIAEILLKCHYDVLTARNGDEALMVLEEKRHDLIITDMFMPGMTGIDLLKTVKTAFPQTGVIIITGYGDVDSYIESMNLGAYEYINKPIKIAEMERIVNNFFKPMVVKTPGVSFVSEVMEKPYMLGDAGCRV